jgi:CRISPR-associated protein Csm5
MSQSNQLLQIETLTPVHVGSGRNLRGNFDYAHFVAENQIGMLDERKIFDLLGRDQLTTWLAMIEKGEDIIPYLRKRKEGLQAADVSRRIASLSGKAPGLQSELREQIHLGAKQHPALPGSSLKGAIKTAVLATLIRNDPAFVQIESNLSVMGRRGKEIKDQKILANYLNQRENRNRNGDLEPSPNEDTFRFLRISDAYFGKTCVMPALMYNMLRSGWQADEKRSPFVECIPKGQMAQTRMQFPKDHIQLVERKGYMSKNLRFVQDLPYLFQTINKHTAHLLQSEIDFWKEERADYTPLEAYIERLEELLSQVNTAKPDTCILRLGYGSGWESMTGRWAKDKDAFGDFILEEKLWFAVTAASRPNDAKYSSDTPFPKTRKTGGGVEPMGFVKISVLQD